MYFLITLSIIILDQVTKLLAIKCLKNNYPIVIIKDYFELRYVENYGAAFGILQQRRWFFIIITSFVLIFLIIYLVKNHNSLSNILKLSTYMLLGGAIGNLIDRIRLGYVVDFLRVNIIKLYDFPVFNIADIFIVIGTILIVYIILFEKHQV